MSSTFVNWANRVATTMPNKIFINYRREDSIDAAGRLHDRLAQAFGHKNIFMDVDDIPAGVDFAKYLGDQVAASHVFLAIIGPTWLDAKDESGGRRIDDPHDFVAIEITAALARNIRVIPVLVEGARMPKAGELPDPLKALARRQAVDVGRLHFGRDAEALVERVREVLNGQWRSLRSRGGTAVAGGVGVAMAIAIAIAIAFFLVGGVGSDQGGILASVPRTGQLDTRDARNANAAAEVAGKRESEEAEQQRVAAVKAEQERRARAEAEAKAKPTKIHVGF
jgi:TIR domain